MTLEKELFPAKQENQGRMQVGLELYLQVILIREAFLEDLAESMSQR